ncbi:MAG TPA: ABC transporter substrate-binding protein [Thermomicrobiaceae bacterium]|nr:ABC transporter substrate-binding protein [Thermomicrobiaceae bacterium]
MSPSPFPARRWRRRLTWFSVLAALTVLVAACGGSSTPATQSTTQGPTPTVASTAAAAGAGTAVAGSPVVTASTPASGGAAQGTFTGAFDEGPGGCPECFNPLTATAGFTWLEEYYEPLVVYDVNFQKMQGQLATSWDISPDGKTYTFHLRPNVKWHDGQSFTSADVKFTLDLVMNPASASWMASYFTDIQSVTTPDPLTAVVTLKQPDAALLDGLTFLVMLPQHALQSISPANLVKSNWWQTNPIGTGPFKWEKYVQGQYVELQANTDYWGGAPKIAHLINRYFKEPGAAVLALQSGQIQFTYVTPDVLATLKTNANIKILQGPSQVVNYLGFNLKDPRLKNLQVREAIMYAINRPEIVSKLFGGGAVVVPCAFNNPKYLPQNANDYAYNVSKAKQLLQQANWNSIKGQPIQVVTYYTDQLSTNVLTTMQQMLAQVGIDITIRGVDVPTYRQILASGNWTMMYAGAANGPDPDVTRTYFVSTATPPNGSNYYGVDIPQLDTLYNQGRQTTNLAQRPAIYQQVCSVLNQQLPWGPMWVTTRYGAVSTKIQDFTWTPSPGGGHYYQGAQDWSIAK